MTLWFKDSSPPGVFILQDYMRLPLPSLLYFRCRAIPGDIIVVSKMAPYTSRGLHGSSQSGGLIKGIQKGDEKQNIRHPQGERMRTDSQTDRQRDRQSEIRGPLARWQTLKRKTGRR